ncbi:MAG TPA: bifunctional 3-deoxy-7-phosphoheptulonate synthase/chorismate mutase type II [Cyclobacteriaceae bacterium]
MESFFRKEKPFIIAGPCSVESYEQLALVAGALKEMNIPLLRAGSWKPRSRPDTFEGLGVLALEWLGKIRNEFEIKVTTEIANPYHVEQALKYEIDVFWIGARTSVNPFVVQEIAEALSGIQRPVLIKNPINPDLGLWLGSIERIEKKTKDVAAVHRGFSSFQPSRFRNIPLWQIPLELRRIRPDLPLICDPSHIAGKRSMILEIAQKSMDLNYDGLMVEVHPDPETALSDSEQQITPTSLGELLNRLEIRSENFTDPLFLDLLEELREKINIADRDLIEALSTRMKLVEQIGDYKKENNVAVFQLERWKEILKSRPEWAKVLGLSPRFIEELYKVIHEESIRIQTAINSKKESK